MMSVWMATSGTVRADAFDQGAIFSLGVAALHVRQHLVIARLDGTSMMFADFGQVAHGMQDAIGHVVGVAGEEADAPQAVDFMDGVEQVRQVCRPVRRQYAVALLCRDRRRRLAVAQFAAPVVAVAVDDLAEQRHLAHALRDQAANFGDDFGHRAAAFDAAAEGNDAEGAGVAAAIDDGHMGGDRRFPLRARCLIDWTAADRLGFVLQVDSAERVVRVQSRPSRRRFRPGADG